MLGPVGGIPLAAELALLPTPRATDGVNGGPGQRGSAGDLAMPSAVQPEHWGRFAAAVARHAAIFGPPPAPTEPNRNGAPRLAPAFAEWLMCVPAGHVTDALPRSPALKAIGNGVCPPQLAAAWKILTARPSPLDMSLGQPLASHSVTTSTTDTAADEVRERQAAARARVIEATISLGVTVDPVLIQAAMMELAQVWREDAEYFATAKRRGWKSTADQLTQAAARLVGFAQSLTASNIVSTGTLVIPVPIDDHPPQCDCGRPECAALSLLAVALDVPAEAALAPSLGNVHDLAEAVTTEAAATFQAMTGICVHPEAQRSTLKSGVIMCTLCGQAVGQATPERLADLVPGARRGPVITGDATLDYLSGATDTYTPTAPTLRSAGPGETVPAELTGSGPMFPGQVGYRSAEHGRPQAPCFECYSIDEDPLPWCDCTPQDGQPCKGPCRLLAHAWTFHPQGCSHNARTVNPDPTKCMYCLADLTQEIAIITPAVDNPFTSPAAPGTNRAPVKRLTFGELGPLVAATYPVPRAHLSHSYVESLSKCGLSALLSDASKAGHLGPRRPSWSLIGGNALHAAVEAIERVAISIGGADPATAAQTPNWEEFWEEALTLQVAELSASLVGTPYANASTWHVANKGLENYDWWRVQGLDMVKKYLAFHDTAWRSRHTLLQVPADPTGVNTARVPVLELPFTVKAGSSAITMEGRIDVAWLATTEEYPTAALEVVDVKAGKSLPVDHFQLVEYGDVLRKHLPVNFGLPIVGRYYRARLGTYTPPVPLPAKPGQDEIDYRYAAADRAMRHAVFAPHVDNMCSSCGSVDFCPAQAMRDA
jgi:hypothetical protein